MQWQQWKQTLNVHEYIGIWWQLNMGGVVLVLACFTYLELCFNQAVMLISLPALWPQRSLCSFSGCLLWLPNKYGPSIQGHEGINFLRLMWSWRLNRKWNTIMDHNHWINIILSWPYHWYIFNWCYLCTVSFHLLFLCCNKQVLSLNEFSSDRYLIFISIEIWTNQSMINSVFWTEKSLLLSSYYMLF